MLIPDLLKYRSCDVVDTCIFDKPQNMTFRSYRGKGEAGLEGYNKLHRYHRSGDAIIMQCQTLEQVFNDRNIKHVDYMSLDIEGAELMALHSIDWDNVQIDVLTVEAYNKGPNSKNTTDLLFEKGYIKKFRLCEDFVFVHQNAKQKLKWIDDWIQTAPWQSVPCLSTV